MLNNKTQTKIEKRKYKRVINTNGIFAVPSSNPTRLCQILDISRSGLSFCYIDSDDWKKKSSKINILIPSDGFCLDRIPIKNISDKVINNSEEYSTMRRCGIKFRRLKASQIYWLEYLIAKQKEKINSNKEAKTF